RLDEATEELEHVRRRLQALNESVVEAAVSGLLSSQRSTDETASVLISRILSGRSPEVSLGDLSPLPSGWTYATLGELAAPEPNAITDGPFGSNLKTSHYTSSGPRVIRLQNIGNGKFQDAEAHISEDHYEKLLKHSVRAGDLVIAALGTELPRACLVPSHVLPAIVKADCIRFRAHPSLSAAYLSIALNARSTRKRTASLVHGVGRPRLNLGEIKGIVLPVPPMAEQARLVSAVDQYVSALERLSVSVCASLVRASVLRRGILDSAFKGLLVPPNPTYSPIIDLVISAAGSAR
ncbi:MAG: hypothetical protein ABSF89_11720, partial [Acidimicrobiales bacterium]